MDFKFKTVAEINAMSEDEQNKYVQDKQAYEQKQNEAAIDKKVSEALKAQEGIINTLQTTVQEQGEQMSKMKTHNEKIAKEDFMTAFKEQYEATAKDGDFSIKGQEKLRIPVEKLGISTDVLSAGTVGAGQLPTAGATRAIDGNVAVLSSTNLGFATYRKPYSPIMDVVDTVPLENENMGVLNETVTGDAAITPECTLKPNVKVQYTWQPTTAAPVAAEWATTTQLRRYYPIIADRIEKKIAELVMDKIPASVLAAVVAGGTAFTPNAALAINSNPNNYDAIGALLAQLQNLGFEPNGIIINPIAYRNMIQEKNDEGVYNLWNGNAIQLVGDTGLAWGGRIIRWILDPTLGVGDVIVGDFMQTVKVGLDNELLYFETDGRTDALASSVSGLSRNIRTHVIERFTSTLIPNATRIGLIKDTFANVKTLITA